MFNCNEPRCIGKITSSLVNTCRFTLWQNAHVAYLLKRDRLVCGTVRFGTFEAPYAHFILRPRADITDNAKG